ncbi:MAG TPA: hypothetical protein VNW99_11875 [Cytophagaceae bacterium]|jgi:hypothetical protein|nr:hypothetical protein [Cytophagaceae bacterium]
MKHIKYLPAFLLLFGLSACWNTENKKEGLPKDTVTISPKDTTGLKKSNKNIKPEEVQIKLGITVAEEKKIMPELGLTYKELQKNLPELQSLKSEDNKGLTGTTARIVMLNKTIDAEFHFKNDSLIKCSFMLNELDYNQADKFYKGLQNFYSSKLGECHEAEVEEENHYGRSCNWTMPGYKAELNYDINKSVITWGIEK